MVPANKPSEQDNPEESTLENMIGESTDITEAPDVCYIDHSKLSAAGLRGKPGSDYEEFVTDQHLQSFMKARFSEY